MLRIMGVCLVAAMALTGCAQPKTICGVTYDSYGLLNSDDKKNPEIEYRLVVGNLIWGILLAETIIAPVYFFGFSIFEPVGPRLAVKGAIGPPPPCEKKT